VKNGIIQHKSALEKLCYFIAICLISKLFFSFISFNLSSIIFNTNLLNITDDLIVNDMNTIRAYKLASVLDQIGTFLIPVILFAKLISKEPNSMWLFNKVNKQQLMLIIPLLIIVITISNILLLLNHNIDLSFLSPEIKNAINDSQQTIDTIHNAFIGMSLKSYLLNIFIMAIVPAFCEELVFRGLLQNLLCKWTKNLHLGVFLSAIIFALLHFQFYNFSALLFIGFAFSYIVALTGTIWITIILHFLFNFYSLTNIYLIKIKVISDESWNMSFWLILIMTTILCSYIVYKKLKKKNYLVTIKTLYNKV